MLGNSQIHLHVLDCSAALCRWSTPASIHFSSPPAYTRDSMFSAALLPSSLATAQSRVRHAQTRAPGGHAPSLANRKHKQSTFSMPIFSYHHPQSTTNDPSCRTPPVLVWFLATPSSRTKSTRFSLMRPILSYLYARIASPASSHPSSLPTNPSLLSFPSSILLSWSPFCSLRNGEADEIE